MDLSDEDLPDVELFSPRKSTSVCDFNMPDASILAARRKTEDEKDILVAKIMEHSLLEISSGSEMGASQFSIADADKLATDRMLEKEKELIIAEIMKGDTPETTDLDVYSCVDTIQSNDGLITIPGENPGVNMLQFNYNLLSNVLHAEGIQFTRSFFNDLYDKDDVERERIISNILQIFYETYSSQEFAAQKNDLICHFFIVCGIILDLESRQVLTVPSTSQVICTILNKVPAIDDGNEMAEELCSLVLGSFKNFHDRLHLSEHFIIKCRSSELTTNPKYYSTMFCKLVLFKTLCALVHFTGSSPSSCESFVDLQRILRHGDKTRSLLPYEQYILLKICSELYWMISTENVVNSKEMKSKIWIRSFFNVLRCNDSDRKTADFFKVRNLVSKVKLLWEMDAAD